MSRRPHPAPGVDRPASLHRRGWLLHAAIGSAAAALPATWLAAAPAATAAPAARTPPATGVIAVPYYNTELLLQMQRRHWYLPQAAAFSRATRQLLAVLTSQCPIPGWTAARPAWIEAMAAWSRLNAVAVGPLLQRRSARAIDFQPPRPRLIDQALAALRTEAAPLPPDAERLARIGSPAKGLPALELLLWHPAYARADATLCAYATGLAGELWREAQALEAAWLAEDQAEPDADALAQAYTEFVNQWLGAVEALRWRDIERPLLAGPADKTGYPRQLSGQTALAWRSHWEAVRTLTLAPAQAPAQGAGLVPMSLYLLGQGHIGLSAKLDGSVRQADAALRQLGPREPKSRQLAASHALAQLKHLIETDAASAAQVHIGFSDADGD